MPRAIFLSDHKAAQRATAGSPIISDLTGMRRVQDKTEAALLRELEKALPRTRLLKAVRKGPHGRAQECFQGREEERQSPGPQARAGPRR